MDTVQCAIIIEDTWYDEHEVFDVIKYVYIKDNLKSAYEYMVKTAEEYNHDGKIAVVNHEKTLNGIPVQCFFMDKEKGLMSNWELTHVVRMD